VLCIIRWVEGWTVRCSGLGGFDFLNTGCNFAASGRVQPEWGFV